MSSSPHAAPMLPPSRRPHRFHALNKIAVDNDMSDEEGLASLMPCLGKSSDEPFSVMWARRGRQGLYAASVYLRLSANDAKNRKGSFCLAFFSVMVVVLVTALMLTTLNNLSILFLRLGEGEFGEIDVVLTPGGQVELANSLNYSVVAELFPTGEYSYHAPRIFIGAGNVRLSNPVGTTGAVGTCESADVRASIALAEASNLPVTSETFRSAVWNSTKSTELTECTSATCVIQSVCGSAMRELGAAVHFIDEEKERRMGYGLSWPYTFPPSTDSRYHRSAIIDKDVATVLGVSVGDSFMMVMDASYPLMQAYETSDLNDRYESAKDSPSTARFTSSNVAVVLLDVWAIADSSYYKLPSSDSAYIFLPFSGTNKLVAEGLSPFNLNAFNRDTFAAVEPASMASSINFNFPPDLRVEKYSQQDYADVRAYASSFAGRIVGAVGFNQIAVSLPVLGFMSSNRFFSLFLGLILAIIITSLAFLCIVLIYSLLTVSIETRTFELGVMRMLGFSRPALTGLVITNALLFALPAWIVGLIVSQALYEALKAFMSSLLGVDLPALLNAEAVLAATAAGIGIPLFASIAPIVTVLTQSLPDALNTERGRVNAVDYRIERQGDSYFSFTIVGMGTCLFVFGFLIYYLFPIALINFNISLLFFIFFGVLLGMLAGLVLLSVNFERFAETVISYVFLFWENSAVFIMIDKNLTAHRPRNRKTTLMYALSIAFIIFITVAFQLQLLSVQYQTSRTIGNEVRINGGMSYDAMVSFCELLEETKKEGLVETYAWESSKVDDMGELSNATMTTLGRYASYTPYLRAISPNFFEATNSEFLIINTEQISPHGYSLGEQLYTPLGSGKAILPTTMKDGMGLDSLDEPFILDIRGENRGEWISGNALGVEYGGRYPLSSDAFLDASPVLAFSKFPTASLIDAVVGAPSLIGKDRSFGGLMSVEQMRFLSISIRVVGGKSGAATLKDRLVLKNAEIQAGVDIEDLYDQNANLDTAATVVNFFFLFTEVIAMVICFFALSSSMSTNILNQAKEIGILRCLGMHRFPTYRLFIWESFVLVSAASVLGLVVGTAVAYTMLLQNSLFSQLPLPFTFPYTQLIVLLAVSFIFAFLASYGPVALLLNLPSITHILRRTI